MIAIPLDTKTSTTISKLYGNVEYFAILDRQTGDLRVIENIELGNGVEVAKFLIDNKINATIFYHMGEGIYSEFAKESIEVYTAQKKLYSLEEIYRGFKNNLFQKLDTSNYKELLDSGSISCKCGTCES